MRAFVLVGLCVVLLPFAVALQCVTDSNGTAVSCPNSTTQCYQTYKSNGTGFVVTYGCSKDECGSECGNSSRCLLTFTPLIHTLCCDYDLCNEEGIIIPHPPARLEFPWQVEFIAFIVYIAILLFFFCYPYYISRKLTSEDLHYLRDEYDIDFDEDPDDEDAYVCFKDEGERGISGFVTLGELDGLAILMKQNKTRTAAELHEDYIYQVPVITKCYHHHAGYRKIMYKPDNLHTLLAHRMMANGPAYFEISPAELLEVLESLNVILRTEGPLLELPGNVVVVGDLRGSYAELMRWFQIHEYPPRHRYLFLGGIVDNSNPFSIETFTLIAALKLLLPHDVFMLRGATEVAPFIIRDRFPKELCNALSLVFASVFAAMPMAAIIGGKVLAVHSGICKKMSSIARLKKREAPLNMGMGKMVRASIFNVPKKGVKGYENIPGSKGQYYGEEALEDCAKALGVSLFLRSRNYSSSGHFFFADRLLLTIWSTNTRDCVSATTVLFDDFLNMEMHAMLPYSDSTTAAEPRSGGGTNSYTEFVPKLVTDMSQSSSDSTQGTVTLPEETATSEPLSVRKIEKKSPVVHTPADSNKKPAKPNDDASVAVHSSYVVSPFAQSTGTGAASGPPQSTNSASPLAQSTDSASPLAQSTDSASPFTSSTDSASPFPPSTGFASPRAQSTDSASPFSQSTSSASPFPQSTDSASPLPRRKI